MQLLYLAAKKKKKKKWGGGGGGNHSTSCKNPNELFPHPKSLPWLAPSSSNEDNNDDDKCPNDEENCYNGNDSVNVQNV